ncbi:FmdB family zinc ribbon protein [Thermosulfurimonas dismutans]|uniref:Putative regulatory protein, FmdB family n=1 Tax=Thermosulfurimonas dismutans TaxID=999894 RepID=A0A179D2A9_9BACT|nr:zinc ribbon domain-containing protein [Thermosulfurimonas dismutans]OAQ20123.1 putative regulatory protein, FmdB family [Thermosulfurimonas dismutans]
MPIYEFRCEDCGEEFETLLKSRSEIETVTCKKCGGKNVKRLMSTITPIVDSGGGGGSDRPRVAETHKCDTGTCTHLELPGHSR